MSSSHTAGGGPFGDPSFSTVSRMSDAAGQSPSVSQSRRNDESWVEISSQPSSSSLSSIGDDTAPHSAYAQRRRRLQQLSHQQTTAAQIAAQGTIRQAGTSSQEEYDETESEEDRLMTSSTENVSSGQPTALQQTNDNDDAAIDDDDDEAATALGNPASAPAFRPQPNVFSHPPSHLTHRHSTSSSQPTRPPFGRHNLSTRSYSRSHRDRLDPMSPSYQADNDAALRASLTTLLSCAAAARGLPKKEDLDIAAGPSMGTGVRPSAAPMALRLVPESELMAETPPPAPRRTQGSIPAPAAGQQQPPLRTASNSSAPSAPSSTSSRDATPEKTKRGASSQQQQGSRPPRATKKKRTSSAAAAIAATDADTATATTLISPSLLTWVVSAGVLVLVSVVGFGAGYVIGREVGRQEGSGAAAALGGGARSVGNVSSSCGQELVRSGAGAGGGGGTLRKFRWGTGVGRSVVA